MDEWWGELGQKEGGDRGGEGELDGRGVGRDWAANRGREEGWQVKAKAASHRAGRSRLTRVVCCLSTRLVSLAKDPVSCCVMKPASTLMGNQLNHCNSWRSVIEFISLPTNSEVANDLMHDAICL